MRSDPQGSLDELPIMCLLTDQERQARRQAVTEDVFSGALEIEELTDGYAFQFPGDASWATRLLAFITRERLCCPFFIFELVFEPAEGPIWLRLRGPSGIKEFLADAVATARMAWSVM